MGNNNEERPIRLRPRPSKRNPNDDPRRYVGALGSVLRFVQMTKRRRRAHTDSQSQSRRPPSARLYTQRVSVRVTYTKNKNPGQWKAHGHYIARDSATKSSDPAAAGFDATRANVNIATTLDIWQRAGDQRIFKIIVSPEFGDRLNLQDQTRQLLARMEKDLGTGLEWVAAAHFNTEHPHVHIAVRGRDHTGSPLRLSRNYIRSGIRFHAENIATEALGFRTEHDAEEAQRREITQTRFTTLDRIIQRSNDAQSSSFIVATDVTSAQLSERQRILQQNLSARLAHLEKLGLARSMGPQQWTVRSDFETILRASQRSNDRQKMLAAHGALLSDPRLPFEITDIRNLKMVEGRVLLHAEDEASGRRYIVLEGIDAKVHLIYHTDSIEEARRAGKLGVNNFVRLEKRFAERVPHIEVFDYGDANALLENRIFFKQQAESHVSRGLLADSNTWGGWLGQYDARLRTSIAMRSALAKAGKAEHER
jgi:type IV secretory pathway VirD2 relaxase